MRVHLTDVPLYTLRFVFKNMYGLVFYPPCQDLFSFASGTAELFLAPRGQKMWFD